MAAVAGARVVDQRDTHLVFRPLRRLLSMPRMLRGRGSR